MKFSLVCLLLAFVVITQQQRSRAMLWYSPYFPQQAIYNNYPPYADDLQVDVPYFRHFRPTAPLIVSHHNGELSLSPEVQADNINQYPGIEDIQSRTKGLSRYSSNKNQKQQQQQGRFFFLLNSGTTGGFNNPLLKTATFTLTSTLTLATVQSCVSLVEFSSGSENVPCRRRRRREILHKFDDSHDQFSIEPSQTQPVTSTVSSRSLDEIKWENDKEFLSSGQIVLSGVSSSQEDPVEVDSSDKHLRDKRFLINYNLFLVSFTVTSYSFVSTTITKQVNFLLPATSSLLNCLPNGYIVC